MLSPAPSVLAFAGAPPFVSFNTYRLTLTMKDAQFMQAPAVMSESFYLDAATAQEAARRGIIVIGRLFTNTLITFRDWAGSTNGGVAPENVGPPALYVNDLKAQPWWPYVHYVCTPNEPKIAAGTAAWMATCVSLLLAEGKEPVGLCLQGNNGADSVGFYVPGLTYYSQHDYSANFQTGTFGTSYAKWTSWFVNTVIPQNPNARMLIGEFGLNSANQGWTTISGMTALNYWQNQIAWYLKRIQLYWKYVDGIFIWANNDNDTHPRPTPDTFTIWNTDIQGYAANWNAARLRGIDPDQTITPALWTPVARPTWAVGPTADPISFPSTGVSAVIVNPNNADGSLTIEAGGTEPPLVVSLTNADGSPVFLPNVTVKLTATRADHTAMVEDVVMTATGTPGEVQYQFAAGDTAVVADYTAKLELTYPMGYVKRAPDIGTLALRVVSG